MKKATVAIVAEIPGNIPRRPFTIIGSGFCIRSEGVVITCEHVFKAFVEPESYQHLMQAIGRNDGQAVSVKSIVPHAMFYSGVHGTEVRMDAVSIAAGVAMKDFDLAALKLHTHPAFPQGYPTLPIADCDYYTPRLLSRILGGEKLAPLANIAQLNRVRPRLETLVIEASRTDPDLVRVRVRVAQTIAGGRRSGAQDLRIFRDGQLVKFQEGPLKDGEYSFDGIRLPSAQSVEFTAYAFNSDRVKSETAHAVLKRPGVHAAPKPKTFEVWLQHGPIGRAVRASIGMPGIELGL